MATPRVGGDERPCRRRRWARIERWERRSQDTFEQRDARDKARARLKRERCITVTGPDGRRYHVRAVRAGQLLGDWGWMPGGLGPTLLNLPLWISFAIANAVVKVRDRHHDGWVVGVLLARRSSWDLVLHREYVVQEAGLSARVAELARVARAGGFGGRIRGSGGSAEVG